MKKIILALAILSASFSAQGGELKVGLMSVWHYGNTITERDKVTREVIGQEEMNNINPIIEYVSRRAHFGAYLNSYAGTSIERGTPISPFFTIDAWKKDIGDFELKLNLGGAYYGDAGPKKNGDYVPVIAANVTHHITKDWSMEYSINPVYMGGGISYTF